MASVAKTAQEFGVIQPPPEVAAATISLEFEFDDVVARTVLAASRQEPPLKVVRAFPVDNGAVLTHLHNVSGGLLGGDNLKLDVRVGRKARVQLTTTGATRIYRPRAGSPVTVQSNNVAVGENALLEYLPDPLIPYAGARFLQRTIIQLALGAGLFWWDILSPGREARGEIFEYERLQMKTEISAGERIIAAEHVDLEPKKRALNSLARLGPYRTYATFYICQIGCEAATWLALEGQLRDASSEYARPGEILWGFSTLAAHGIVARCLAQHGRDIIPGLHAVWNAAKMQLYGCRAEPPRKVN